MRRFTLLILLIGCPMVMGGRTAPRGETPSRKACQVLARHRPERLATHVIPPNQIRTVFLSTEDLDRTFFTADQHFGHDRILPLASRGYRDVSHMREMQILAWNRKVPAGSTVYVLGDIAMNLESMGNVVSDRLNGDKVLLSGNHDLCHPANQKCRSPEDFERHRRDYLSAGFSDVTLALRLIFPDGQTVYLNHYPFLDDESLSVENRGGLPFLLQDDGHTPLLCGHVHARWKINQRMINVGVDVNESAPVSAREILELLEAL